MVSQTFKNLAPLKKERITAALLTEFSTYPLKDSKQHALLSRLH